MNEYSMNRISTNPLVGHTPSYNHPKRKGSTKNRFPVRSEMVAIQQGIKERFKSAVKDYLKKENPRIYVFFEFCNYQSIKIGNLIQCETGIYVVLKKLKNELYLGDSDGEEQNVKFDLKSKELSLISINRKTLENFI